MGFARGGGHCQADMRSRGEGFGTERERLTGDGLGRVSARLARVDFRGQFYERGYFKRNYLKNSKC